MCSVVIPHAVGLLLLWGTCCVMQNASADHEGEVIEYYGFERKVAENRQDDVTLYVIGECPRATSALVLRDGLNELLSKVIDAVPSLRKIHFAENATISPYQLKILWKCAELNEIQVGCRCDAPMLDVLSKLPKVHTLQLQDVDGLELRPLTQFVNVRHLDLRLTGHASEALISVPVNQLVSLSVQCPIGEVLEFPADCKFAALEFLSVAGSFTGHVSVFSPHRLKTLWQKRGPLAGKLSREQVASLASLTAIESLEVDSPLNEFGDADVARIADSLPMLHHFSFRCLDLSSATLKLLLSKPRLTSLSFCGPIEGRHIELLREARHLKVVNIFVPVGVSKFARKELERALPETDISFFDELE